MSLSNSERFVAGGEAVEKHVGHSKLEKLKRLRKTFNWKFENHRFLFYHEFEPLVRDWKEQLPNLHEIFTKQEMDWLLVASIKSFHLCQEIVEFVIRTGYKDEPDLDKDGKPLLRRTTAVHRIAECYQLASKIEVLKNLFTIYDNFHVNYTDELGNSHFHMACKYGLDDVAKKFLELGQDPNCLVPGTGDSMLYFVAAKDLSHSNTSIILLLLKHGADASQTKEDGSTLLHVICQNRDYYTNSVVSMLLESVYELQQTALINAQDKWGDTPLHLALKDCYNIGTVQELLWRGADPNLANAKGQTPLHVICQSNGNDYMLKRYFDICDEKSHPVLLDIQDNEGNTPLHLSILCENAVMIESLLRQGADPTLANAEGLTPLHILCEKNQRANLLKRFFKICDEKRQPVLLNVRDESGNTPLHWAISSGNALMVRSLLRRGADPCLANAEGLPPLHLIARRDVHGDMIRMFLRTNEERQQTVGIDTRDNLGRTALEWAVTSCLPLAVKSLLSHNANVSGFVFPTPSDSDNLGRGCSLTKLTAATGLLAIVELLESRGYKMSRDDALKLMGFFDEYGLYESMDFSTSKDVDDLVDSLFEEMAKKRTYMNYLKFVSSYKLRKIPYESMEACSVRLCEKILTKFCRDWALDSFMELIHYRLPIICSEIIVEKLKNKNLFNICLAAAGRSSRQ